MTDTPDTPVQLDPQYLMFVEKYFELNFNQTKAAAAAGFSARSARNQGYRLMKNDDIRKEIERRFAEDIMSKNEVLARLANHARGDIRNLATVSSGAALARHPNGNLVKKFERIVTTTSREDGQTVKEEKIKLELYNAQDATVHLGRYHSLFTDKHDVTTDGKPLMTPTIFLPAVEADE